MADSSRSRNHVALALLIVGKVLGVGGLAIASTSRIAGGLLLVLDGALIVAAVVLCLRTMKARAKEDDSRKALLRQMMKEGTLKQYLRDLEQERRAAPSAELGPEAARELTDDSGVRGHTALS